MEIEQQVRKLGGRKHIPLDSAKGSDEERLDPGVKPDELTGDGQARIQVAACPATGEDDPHEAADSGSVAERPITFSRVLPMFTRIPVKSRVRTRFERP